MHLLPVDKLKRQQGVSMRTHRLFAGFTLIEVLTVLVLLGILTAIAIPVYLNFMVRARVVELINISSHAKATVVDYRLTYGTMPNNSSELNFNDVSTPYVTNLTIGQGGQIIITGNTTNLGTNGPISIILTPTYTTGAVSWTCSSTGATQYVPSSCR